MAKTIQQMQSGRKQRVSMTRAYLVGVVLSDDDKELGCEKDDGVEDMTLVVEV